MLDYKNKVIKALSLTKHIDDVNYIRQKIYVTEQINRRTIQGREFTEELLALCQKRIYELEEYTTPF